jgi:hypothetical protein
MELSELKRHEVVVLAALTRMAAFADHRVSDDEASAIHIIAEEVGEELFSAALAEAEREIGDRASLRARLGDVVRREAQELLFGTVLDLSIQDSVDVGEDALLDLLTEVWGVSAQFEIPDELAEGDDEEPEG